jgi:tetratricopeptide (TPR) repeat protein
MDGRPWLEAFEKPAKPEYIFSWEGVGDDIAAGLHTEHARQDPAEAAAAIEHLVALGYIAAPSEDARKAVQETIRCNKTNRVRSLLGTPQEAKAVPILQELLGEKNDNEWVLLTLARCFIRLGRVADARSILDTSAPALQELGQVQLVFAELAFAEEDPEAALRYLQTAESKGGRHPLLFNQIGHAYLILKRLSEAGVAFEKSLEVEPDNPAALDGLAHVHLESGEPEMAVEKSLQAVGLIHYFPEAHYHLGLGLERLDKIPEAILAYETALGMGYRKRLIHSHLAKLYQGIDPAKADRHKRLLANSQKPRVYRADVKSTFGKNVS